MDASFLWIVITLMTVCCYTGDAEEAILMDTRTATSDVGWTKSQGSMWQEVSSPHPDKSDRRMLMVCEIRESNQDNWVRTPYISVDGASRLYVEFEFTIRSCEDVANVATCKETFNLYYYETDRDEATTTFPPWREGAYIKVDTIAADKRFSPGSHETNFETREIGPLTKTGVYLALQDSGACMALMHMRVYYKYCRQSTRNLAVFARTGAGPEVTSLVEASGTCVRNAIAENGVLPSLHCNGKGEWAVPKGSCICAAGYSPDPALTSCRACGRGQYKASNGNGPCRRCPAYSHSRDSASSVCECMYGYLRAPLDDPTSPCTKTPSKPENLRAAVNQTSVRLIWDRPLNDGGRDDLTYRVQCLRCQFGFEPCTPCSNGVDFTPAREGLVFNDVTVHDLSAFAYYKFKVFAVNGVSDLAVQEDTDKSYAVVTVETSQAAPSAVLNVQVNDVIAHAFSVTWNVPARANGRIKQYEVIVSSTIESEGSEGDSVVSHTSQDNMKVTGLTQDTEYVVKVRARTLAGYGPYSIPVKTKTRQVQTTPHPAGQGTGGINFVHLIIAVAGGCLFIIVTICAIVLYRKRSRKFRAPKLDFEKFAMLRTGSLRYADAGYTASLHKTYIDPTTYEDPQRAVLDFTKEIDASHISIEEVIGGGEFGEVCRGRTRLPCAKGEQQVAIKTLKSGYSTQQKLDFLGEASIMGQFDHPNVIRLEGVVTRSKPHMIITEFMENGSLDAFLRKHDGEFSVIQLVGMLRNIAAGMKYLSDMGYVHRDLAARNILVNAQLICKVSDFGLSRILEEDSDATYTTRGGKIPIRWTAPEAITYRKFTSASDVWSYGIVMWEVMSYGERPYWGMSNQDVIQAVGTGYRLPAPMDCPQVQHHLMLECWKKNRSERPKFAQIVASLDRMLREPSQLKQIAGHDQNSNDRLLNEHGSLAGYSLRRGTGDSESSTLLLQRQPDNVELLSRSIESISSLGRWLEVVGMSSYKENFTQNGCASLEQLLQLNPSDLTRMGISDSEEQDRFMAGILSLKRANNNCSRGEPPKYSEERITGIPV